MKSATAPMRLRKLDLCFCEACLAAVPARAALKPIAQTSGRLRQLREGRKPWRKPR